MKKKKKKKKKDFYFIKIVKREKGYKYIYFFINFLKKLIFFIFKKIFLK